MNLTNKSNNTIRAGSVSCAVDPLLFPLSVEHIAFVPNVSCNNNSSVVVSNKNFFKTSLQHSSRADVATKLTGLFRPTARLFVFQPPEPPFAGDEGEPETAEPSFVWGYLIDKRRYKLKETKKMQFQDEYLTFLLQPKMAKYQAKLRKAYGNEMEGNREIHLENRKVLWRERPFEFPFLDQTSTLKRIRMADIAPGGLSMPNRNNQMAKFLAQNPESRIQLRPRIDQLGGFIGGRTPYS